MYLVTFYITVEYGCAPIYVYTLERINLCTSMCEYIYEFKYVNEFCHGSINDGHFSLCSVEGTGEKVREKEGRCKFVIGVTIINS